METITTIQGKLLYFAKHLNNTKKLTSRELGVLKGKFFLMQIS